MYRRACAALLFLGFCLVASTSPAAAREKRSPYAGVFSGEWTFRSSNVLFPNTQRGRMTLAIAPSGKVTGTLVNLTFGRQADIKGFIDEDGRLDVSFEFANQAYTLRGTVNKTRRGLRGTVGQYFGRDNPVGTIELDLPSR